MKILHFKDLGDTSLGVNLVVDNLFDVVSDTSLLYKFESNDRTITYRDIAF